MNETISTKGIKPLKNGGFSLTIHFNDNKLAKFLFGQYDEHLDILEKMLGVEAITRGNELFLSGDKQALQNGELALGYIYERLQSGQRIDKGDVSGAIRLAVDLVVDGEQHQMKNGKSTKTTNKDRGNSSGSIKSDKNNKNTKLNAASIATKKRVIQARTRNQDRYIQAMNDNELVFGAGPAGTGKTFLAVAYAASLLEKGAIERIILSRPAVEAGERLGFLPGDMKEKVDPYLRPLYDALYEMMPGDKVERALENGTIEIAPLAFMRGRTLSNAAIILDEAQNTTSMQMKMFLTRLGENSKMIVTGDPSQIDLPKGQLSGLSEALAILPKIEGIEKIVFEAKDVVRHHLVTEIVNAYDAATKTSKKS